MREIKPCLLCGWCDGTHKPTTTGNQTETTIDEPVNKPIAVFKFNLAEYKRKMLYQKANEILNGGDE